MKLLDRIRQTPAPPSPVTRYTIDDYVDWVTNFTFNGLTYQGIQQTLADGRPEEIDRAFTAYVTAAYKSSGIVFACILLRMQVFSQARFVFQQFRNARPGDFFGWPTLSLLEKPWLGGTTSDLLAQMEVDASLAGNFYGVVADGELVRLRPDWTSIVLEPRMIGGGQIGWKRVGYVYREGGHTADGRNDVLLTPSEVVHYAPYPDPEANFRGESWLSSVIREVQADRAATKHKQKFFDNGATVNLLVRTDPGVIDTIEKFRAFIDAMDEAHRGGDNAYKTLYLAGAADAKPIGADMGQMQFTDLQGKAETRVAMAAGTHPALVGMSEGMQGSSLNAGNLVQVRRRFADTTMYHLWMKAAGALETAVPPPPGAPSRLWFDTAGVPFLRDDNKDEAETRRIDAETMRQLGDGGWEPESIKLFMASGDHTLLQHTGMLSVQLQEPGAKPETEQPEVDTESSDE